jgi:hypothetical protein
MNVMEITQLAFHPLAEVFPLMEGKEFAELATSIKVNGLRDAIVMFEGKVLDGRNRYRACLKAGVNPRTEEFSGDDPVAFVMDHNLHRRHLTSGEKAMAVQKFATLSKGRKRNITNGSAEPFKTRAEIAKRTGLSPSTISEAKIIIAEGTADEIFDVSTGKRSITRVSNEVRARRGPKPNKPPKARGGMRAQKRLLRIFQRALSLLCNNLEHIEDIDLPKLTEDQKKSAVTQLLEAERALRKLKGRVRHGGTNVGKV